METDREQLFGRIQKVLALSASPVQAEAEAALKKFHELLKRYNLSEAEVKSKVTHETHLVEEVVLRGRRLYDWEKFLLHPVAESAYCDIMYRSNGGDFRAADVVFVGRPVNIAAAHSLYDYLRAVIIRMSKGLEGKERQDYCYGIVYGLSERLREEKVTEDNCRELAIITTEASEYIKQNYPSIKLVRRKHKKPSSAFVEGCFDSSKVSLHKQFGLKGISHE